MMEESNKPPQNLERVLLKLSERLTSLEQRVAALERPTLMYRRPHSSDHESLSDTLDFLHNNVEGLKKDLGRIASTV